MSIYIDDYLSNKSNFAAYQAKLNTALGFKDSSGKQSKWVRFLENHDIVIAPGEGNVGETFVDYKGKAVSTIPSDTRTYDTIPGTFFAKGTVVNGIAISKHIVYLNMKYASNQFTSINFFAHELGHAIDHALAQTASYYSLESGFNSVYDASKDFFKNTNLHQNTKQYLEMKNEFFAECFAFYRTKNTMLKDNECFHLYFGNTLPVDDQTITPHDYLKKYAPVVCTFFKGLV